MRDALKLAGWAALGYLAWQWLQGSTASAAPPAVEPPTTPPVVPPTPGKVPWPKGGAAERARAMGFTPRATATPAQRERAWSFMPQWTPDSVWPDPSDADTLYVAAVHGRKKGVEVWGRARGKAAPPPGSPGTETMRKLAEIADAGRASTSPGILRALAATAATMGPRGQALAAELAAKAAAIEATGDA